ncbi:glutathione-disulfide reductase [Dyella nitratireducens]|uniref:Glutathione-disulfide reductase n=1 Tax=Dyella nitratireducens TaxID=1849580 RepID=A0ABQ1G5R0_9GAMM|nr:glutathione-disulfide reductase [Dyella nitratireducens]GGA36570.1 glutathione-disulfide reductase [Dyella nitratireducens]GLQ41086.1 glutathione-disulfide reductase [Dyella nitratireducens]
MSERFDLIVLGAGSGGLSAAQHAARLGARVALFDPDALGGTCVNRGCVPKKAMWFAAQIADMHRIGAEIGFETTSLRLDWARFRTLRDQYIAGIRHRYATRLDMADIRVMAEAARLASNDMVVTAQGTQFSAPHIVIATGARPRRLDMQGFELGMLSDQIFMLDAPPQHIAIVGGGYVAVEFACVMRSLGCQVDLLVRENLLTGFDLELVEALAVQMQSHGIRIVRNTQIKAARGQPGEVTLEATGGVEHGIYDAVLWAVGRVPNSDDLGLEQLGVECDEAGHVLVDAFQNTSVPGIYAVGDVTDRRALTPVAVAAGRALAERLIGGHADAKFDDSVIPSVVFSEPPLGSVGLTEQQARARYGDAVNVHTGRYTPLLWMVAGRSEQNVVKLLSVGEERKVVGIHVLGPGSDELLQGFAVAMQKGLTWQDLKSTIAIHPTAAEELLLLH